MNALTERFRRKWAAERAQAAFLALADGAVFRGVAFGARKDALGEAVFNTGMTGYQEILTDPSYAGQFVVLTAPEIGNYGCNPEDAESRALFLSGLVVRNVNPPSNFRAAESLGETLLRGGRPGIYGVDTRALTLHLRDHGAQRAYLHVEDAPLDEIGQGRAGLFYNFDVRIDGRSHFFMAVIGNRQIRREDGDFFLGADFPGRTNAAAHADEGIRHFFPHRLVGHGRYGIAADSDELDLFFAHKTQYISRI